MQKRVFDIVLVLLMAPFLVPVMAGIALVILLREGRPVFYVSERMRGVNDPFMLWKFRTMHVNSDDAMASGGHKAGRVTKTGAVLRKYRMDELPQLWNILRGDISFVGPRPPLRRYVEMFPEIYGEVLKTPPGVTGLATLVYHRTEERILARCTSAAETDATYARRCVPRKAKIDLIYSQSASVYLDMWIILATLRRSMRPAPKIDYNRSWKLHKKP